MPEGVRTSSLIGSVHSLAIEGLSEGGGCPSDQPARKLQGFGAGSGLLLLLLLRQRRRLMPMAVVMMMFLMVLVMFVVICCPRVVVVNAISFVPTSCKAA